MTFLLGAVVAVLLICLLFMIRLLIVVKTGSKHKPGSKGPVAALVVAGSGNVSLTNTLLVVLAVLCSAGVFLMMLFTSSDCSYTQHVLLSHC